MLHSGQTSEREIMTSTLTAAQAEEWTQASAQGFDSQFRFIDLGITLGVPAALGLTAEQWVQQRLGGYIKLAIVARREAHKELEAKGLTQREISERTGVDQATVSRDLDATASGKDGKAKVTRGKVDASASDPTAALQKKIKDLEAQHQQETSTLKAELAATGRELDELREQLEEDDDVAVGVIVDPSKDGLPKLSPVQLNQLFAEANVKLSRAQGQDPIVTDSVKRTVELIEILHKEGWFQ